MTPDRKVALLSLFASVLAAAATVGAQIYPPPFPRPNATKLMETERVVVWDIVWPKGQPSPLHQHVFDQVGTYYAAGGRVITDIKGVKRFTTTEVGAISTTRKGTLHIEEGTTDSPLRAVFIELKYETPSGETDAASDSPPALPRDGAKRVHDDDRVTIWDYTAAPGQRSVRYARDTITVWLGAGTLRWTPQGGAATLVTAAPGKIEYSKRGTAGSQDVIEGSRAIIFELK